MKDFGFVIISTENHRGGQRRKTGHAEGIFACGGQGGVSEGGENRRVDRGLAKQKRKCHCDLAIEVLEQENKHELGGGEH